MKRSLKFKDGGYGWGRKHELEEPALEPSVAVRDHVGTVLAGGKFCRPIYFITANFESGQMHYDGFKFQHLYKRNPSMTK